MYNYIMKAFIVFAVLVCVLVGAVDILVKPKPAIPQPPFAINVKSQSLYGHDYLVFVATSGEAVEGTSVIHSESCTNHTVAAPQSFWGGKVTSPILYPGSLFYQHPTVSTNDYIYLTNSNASGAIMLTNGLRIASHDGPGWHSYDGKVWTYTNSLSSGVWRVSPVITNSNVTP